MAMARFETQRVNPAEIGRDGALLMKWFALTLALPVFFPELLTHGLGDDGALLGFGLE